MSGPPAFNLDDVQSFLKAAASDEDFRDDLQNKEADDLRDEIHRRFHLEVQVGERPRRVPTPDVCNALLDWISSESFEYDDVSAVPSVLGPICFVVGHAMPLVASAEGTVVAAR